jgi:hypothetical protein
MIFGVAEDHDSNPIKTGLGKLKERGAKIVSINPVKSGYNGHCRRVGRHPPRHRRTVDPARWHSPAAEAPARSTSIISPATPMRPPGDPTTRAVQMTG